MHVTFSGNLVVTSFSEIQSEGCYQIDAKQDLGDLRLLAIEDILTNIVTTCRWVLGHALPITKLRCNYPAPPHAARYQSIFQCPVEFDAPATQLFFDAAILDQPLPQSSPQSAALYKKLCEEQSIARNQGNIAWRLCQIMAGLWSYQISIWLNWASFPAHVFLSYQTRCNSIGSTAKDENHEKI